MTRHLQPTFVRYARLSLLAYLTVGCMPSDFDDLKQPGSGTDQNPASECDAGALTPGCQPPSDGGAHAPSLPADAASAAPSDASTAPSDAGSATTPDASTTPPDASTAPTPDPSTTPPDASTAPPDVVPDVCAGRPIVCRRGMMDTEMEACGSCNHGVRSRTRPCAEDGCTWGAFGAWSDCTGGGVCSPGDVKECAYSDSCGVRVCAPNCTWDETCVPKQGAACVRRRITVENGQLNVQNEGDNYRCCGDGRWSFCLPSCQWSTECASCDPRNCEC